MCDPRASSDCQSQRGYHGQWLTAYHSLWLHIRYLKFQIKSLVMGEGHGMIQLVIGHHMFVCVTEPEEPTERSVMSG